MHIFRIIPYIQRYNRSVRKIKQEVMKHHKEQIDKLNETNWNRCKEGLKNVETDMHKVYKKEIAEVMAQNNDLRSGLKDANERYIT